MSLLFMVVMCMYVCWCVCFLRIWKCEGEESYVGGVGVQFVWGSLFCWLFWFWWNRWCWRCFFFIWVFFFMIRLRIMWRRNERLIRVWGVVGCCCWWFWFIWLWLRRFIIVLFIWGRNQVFLFCFLCFWKRKERGYIFWLVVVWVFCFCYFQLQV